MNPQNKKLVVLLLLFGVGCSLIWVLPREGERRLSCLSPELPLELGLWKGKKGRPSPAEVSILSQDTEFSRMSYSHATKPPVEVSVVFSGRDINNSIHRPERCLKAQGWNFLVERTVKVENVLADGVAVSFREIVCSKPRLDKERKPVMLDSGEQMHDYLIQYYTFFGHADIVEGHYQRTFIDMRDRLFGGFDQQWAYATFSAPVMAEYARQGFAMEDYIAAYDIEKSKALLEEVIRELLPNAVDQS